MIEVTRSALAAHPFLRGMPRGHLDALVAAASYVTFPAGQRIFAEGGYASKFWLIQSGHVALDLYVSGEGPAVIDTVRMGEVLGWSWLFPPYRWAFGAACASTVEAFEFDATGYLLAQLCGAVGAAGLLRLLFRLAWGLRGRPSLAADIAAQGDAQNDSSADGSQKKAPHRRGERP